MKEMGQANERDVEQGNKVGNEGGAKVMLYNKNRKLIAIKEEWRESQMTSVMLFCLNYGTERKEKSESKKRGEVEIVQAGEESQSDEILSI